MLELIIQRGRMTNGLVKKTIPFGGKHRVRERSVSLFVLVEVLVTRQSSQIVLWGSGRMRPVWKYPLVEVTVWHVCEKRHQGLFCPRHRRFSNSSL